MTTQRPLSTWDVADMYTDAMFGGPAIIEGTSTIKEDEPELKEIEA